MLFEKIQLEEDEKILKIVHKHWFLFFTKIFGVFITAIFPLLAWVILELLLQTNTSSIHLDLSNYLSYFSFYYSAWLLGNWMILASILTDLYLDLWVITDRRIIIIDQKGLFKRNIGSFRLERLQDVNITINGIVATFLNYGTIAAQTASENEERFRSSNLPHPRELKSIILNATDERLNKQHGHIE